MKKEQLSDALNLLDDDLLEETDRLRKGIGAQDENREESVGQGENRRKRTVGKTRWKWIAGKNQKKWTAAAAVVCMVLAAVGGSALYGRLQEHSRRSDKALTENSHPNGVAGSGDSRPDGGQGALTENSYPDGTEGSADSRLDGNQGTQEENSYPNGAEGSGDSASDNGQGSENTTGISQFPAMESGEGFEGYRAYDASELVNANPWTEEMEISALPVYRNSAAFRGQYGTNLKADLDKMEEYLKEVAGRLGLDTDSLVITDDVPDEETRKIIMEKLQIGGGTVPEGYFNPTRLITEADGMKIEVDQYMTASVYFEPAIELPAEYRFNYSASYEELEKTAGYLEEEFREFMGMEQPRQDINGGGYDIYFRQQYKIAFYETGEDAVEQILQYNFNRVSFACDDEGKLFLARIYRPDISEKEGDYPIITAEEARELLTDGSYVTTVPGEMPGEKYIRAVELVYRTGNWDLYYMPYYRFTVELPNPYGVAGGEKEDGLKSYGAYYVPAVESEYLEDMPGWDGRVN
ncbi:MAG TPA: hypothetical protein DCZ91_17705 [Lachnospiraceae bacterium]|nr:hypothetical protein [Lachnospiraceae bacterium]